MNIKASIVINLLIYIYSIIKIDFEKSIKVKLLDFKIHMNLRQ